MTDVVTRKDTCVYKINPGLYGRVFASSTGTAWSASCGKGSPYYLTHKPIDGQPCNNCGRPIKLAPGTYNYDVDWEDKRLSGKRKV